MNYNIFLKDVKENNIKSSYLFYGEEEYLMNETLDLLKRQYIDSSLEALNFTIIEGKDTSLDTIINACETLPFMSSKKIVIVRDINTILENEGNGGESELYQYLDNLGAYLLLIIMGNNIKKSNRIYKYFNKQDKVVEFSNLKGKDLNMWVEKILKKNNRFMNFSNLNFFTQQTAYTSRNTNLTLYDLENELLKLVNYSSTEEITKDDISKVLIKSIDTNIFDLLGAINKGDSHNALVIFNNMYIQNEPIQRILVMITRQIRLMLGYKLYKNKGYGEGEIQDKLGIKSYEYSKITFQSREFTILQLEHTLDNILYLDKQLKTTATDEKILMEMLIVEICNKN